MAKRIYPLEITVDSHVVPSGFEGAGKTRFTVSISDARHSKELLCTWDIFSAIKFSRRSAGRRGLPINDKTLKRG